MPYHLEGRLLELCTCGAYCPCQPAGERTVGDCNAVNAWHIDRGAIEGIDVAGLTLVALSKVHGYVLQGRPVVFYVDATATDQQQEALLKVWTGKLGGPVADVARLIGEVAGVERASMDFQIEDGKGWLKVAEILDANLAVPAHEGTDHAAIPHDDVCTTIPGSEANSNLAARYRVKSPTYGFDLDLQNYQVMQGRFQFDG